MRAILFAALLTGCAAARAATPPANLRYDLDVSMTPPTHELVVKGRLVSPRPITSFYLHDALTLDTLTADGAPVKTTRDGTHVLLATPARALDFTYHGALPVPGARDAKSHTYL